MLITLAKHRRELAASQTKAEAHQRDSEYWEGAAERIAAKLLEAHRENRALAADLAAANAKIARMTGGLIPGGPKAKAKREATPGSAPVRAAMEAM